jgi:hypothetical protein
MYKVIRANKYLATTDSFMGAVHMAQLAGGALIKSARTETNVGKNWALKKRTMTMVTLKPAASNLIIMTVAYLLCR